MTEILPGLATPAEARDTPTLPGCVDGIIGRDPWVVVCRDCGATASGTWLYGLVAFEGFRFHARSWPDGTNPRLCRACRLARWCDCYGCRCEEQGTSHPTYRTRRKEPPNGLVQGR